MASVPATAAELHVETGAAAPVEAEAWEPADTGNVGRPADGAVSGRAVGLKLPAGAVQLERERGPATNPGAGRTELSQGTYRLTVRSSTVVTVSFDERATLAVDRERVRLSFPEPTRVTVRTRGGVANPPGGLVVPPTEEGVATALTFAAASHRTTTADRSMPTMRRYPPPLTFGDERIPQSVADARPPSDLTFHLPDSLDSLFAAAPLAYYLGARVAVSQGATPRLVAPDWTYTFDEGLPSAVGDLLQRAFRFDCLVRGAGPRTRPLPSASATLDRLGVDAGSLYDATPAERLEAVLETGYEATEAPQWPLSLSVEPTVGNARALPHLLRDLPILRRPSSEPLETRERLSRCLDDFFRSGVDVPAFDLVDVEAGPGATHGWLASGVPIDVFDTVPAAYEHRFAGRRRDGGEASVEVVCNDAAMSDAFDAVAAVYCGAEGVDLTTRRNLTTAELARVFESRTDFVHYVGHCEESGLRCADGTLSTGSLDAVGARSFFLNACGSYYEGRELVRRGSVAGAVTLDAVLDAPARRVSRTFTRLLVTGFDLQRALELARRRIVMSKDYTVVGDGTHRLAGIGSDRPSETRVTPLDDGRFRVEDVVRPSRAPGGQYWSALDGETYPEGTARERVVSASELPAVLDDCAFPVLFDGDVREPAVVAARVGATTTDAPGDE